MVCPNCDGEIKVLDTISTDTANYRQRKCLVCGYKFFSEETITNQDKISALFAEWSTQRSKKARLKKKGIDYEPTFADGREKQSAIIPKKPTSPLF